MTYMTFGKCHIKYMTCHTLPKPKSGTSDISPKFSVGTFLVGTERNRIIKTFCRKMKKLSVKTYIIRDFKSLFRSFMLFSAPLYTLKMLKKNLFEG